MSFGDKNHRSQPTFDMRTDMTTPAALQGSIAVSGGRGQTFC